VKKLLVFLLVTAVLTGCAQIQQLVPTESTEPATEEIVTTEPETEAPTEPETEPTPIIQQLPMVAVSVPHTVETITSSTGDVIYRKTTQTMHLTMRDPDVADRIILDFLNRIDVQSSDEQYVREAAEGAYSGDSYWDAYFFDLIYNPTRVDHSVLSLSGEAVSYSGGNHPQRTCIAANYNMVTGDVLTLGSILYHIDAKDKLVDLVIQHLDAIAEEKHLLGGYQDVVRKRFARDESFDEDWYFTNDGLCFYFAPYEIAPYTSGIIVAEIPYGELAGVIADEFFPPEEDVLEGNIVSVPMENADLDQFSQIAELTIDQEGDLILLYAAGAVRNVQIQSGAVNTDNGHYEAAYTLFGTYTLSPGDAIMLKVEITEDSPLRICFESGGELHHLLLGPN